MNPQFDALHLRVVELPIEFGEMGPIYRGYLRELPFITGEAQTKQQLYRQLLEQYQAYAQTQQQKEEEAAEMTSSLLNYEDLLKYYDGESFDGFEWTES
ncbi:hypothetical protein ACYSNO_11980 [Enterococcus sp. LJL98]